ncbi:MAG: hypothetical protein ACK42E_05615 [Candidatus Bipolaricaulaceae bacterium]
MPGLKAALTLGTGVILALTFFRPSLALGALLGLGAVVLSRLAYVRLLKRAWAEGRPQALIAASLGKFGILTAAALLGIAVGGEPVGVAIGLFLFPLGLWLSLGFHVLRTRR